MGLGVAVLRHDDDGELRLEEPCVVVAEKIEVGVGDAHNWDSRVDHHVTHEHYYAGYHHSYGYDGAENGC